MKRSRRPLFYLTLISVILLGVWAQKEREKPITKVAFKVEENPVLVEPVSLSTKLRAEKANRVLAAKSQEVFVTEEGDNLLVLINKTIRLPETYEPKDLIYLDDKVQGTKQGLRLRETALEALTVLGQAAKKEGLNLIVSSAYRSYWSQLATYQNKVAVIGPEATKTFGARPGHSQHQLGTAVDFDFLKPDTVVWLETNAYKYGFALSYPEGKEEVTGYVYEPWHYRFIGTRAATSMVESGLILEEYLQTFGVW